MRLGDEEKKKGVHIVGFGYMISLIMVQYTNCLASTYCICEKDRCIKSLKHGPHRICRFLKRFGVKSSGRMVFTSESLSSMMSCITNLIPEICLRT